MSKNRKLLILTFLLAFLFTFSSNDIGKAATLNDIPADYASEINYLLDRSVIIGYPGGYFYPDKNVTRAEAATIIGRAIDLDGTQRETSFPDVGKESYASGYIQSAVENGIITGHDNHTFRPEDPITRGHMAFLLQRAFSLTGEGSIKFKDVTRTDAQTAAINLIASAGLTNGYPDGTYKPDLPITRVQYALFVARGLNQDFRVSVVTQPVVSKPIIALDPGHGGTDPGAIGNGLYESEINLSVALKVEKLLNQKGIQVVMTRRDDRTLGLTTDRVPVGVNANADAFVSIHANSNGTDTTANGTETYYSTASTRANDSKQLAIFIQNRLYPALDTRNRGVKTAGFWVIDKNPLPAVLVELGFIRNPSDSRKLASDTYRNKAAEAIALGIQDYLKWKGKL